MNASVTGPPPGQQAEQHVLGADVVVAQAQGRLQRALERVPWRSRRGSRRAARPPAFAQPVRRDRRRRRRKAARGSARPAAMACAARPSGSANRAAARCAALTGDRRRGQPPGGGEHLGGAGGKPGERLALSGIRSPALVGTKRFCAACLVTPIAPPIWLHDSARPARLVHEVADQRVGLLVHLGGDGERVATRSSSGPPSGCRAFT